MAIHTNSYANEVKRWNGDYGYKFNPTTAAKCVRGDGITVRNNNSIIGSCWDQTNKNQYDIMMAKSFGLRRWFDIKSCMKLCKHNKEIRRGEDENDPTAKCRKVWGISIANLNQFIQRGGLDLAINETTWANGLYADIQHRLRGKKVNKGGQHTMAVDAQSCYIYGYTPRHNRFTHTAPFTAEGPAKVKRLVEILNPLVIGEENEEEDGRR